MKPGGPAGPRRIVLTGFMGAGKSTVGRLLAAQLDWPFADLDEHISAEHQLSVADIFARHGEAHFRALEVAAVERLLQSEPAVIALGGGAIETPEVRALLFPSADSPSAPRAVTIYLAAPLGELLSRCHITGAPVRPLLHGSEDREQRFARRLPFYRMAHLILDTEGLGPEQVVEHILTALFAGQASRRETSAQ